MKKFLLLETQKRIVSFRIKLFMSLIYKNTKEQSDITKTIRDSIL